MHRYWVGHIREIRGGKRSFPTRFTPAHDCMQMGLRTYGQRFSGTGPERILTGNMHACTAKRSLSSQWLTLSERDTAAIGNSERLLSDDIDLVHCSSFEAEIRMHSFREGDLNQAPIPDGDRDFYTRYTLDHEARVVRV